MEHKHEEGCIFCQIAAGEAPCHLVTWDNLHMAFLDIFPNTPGATVVIPKDHYSSDYTQLPSQVRTGLSEFLAEVMELLADRLPNVGRCGVAVEGYGIDHFHYKVYPLHGTPKDGWREIRSPIEVRELVSSYRGYFTTASGPPADFDQLAELARKLRSE